MSVNEMSAAAPSWRRFLRPQVLLSVLVCLVCLGIFLSTLRRPNVPLTQIDIQQGEDAAPQIFEIVVLRNGESEILRQNSSLGISPNERLQNVLVALAATDIWPADLDVPSVFVFETNESIALLNFSAAPDVSVSAEQEWDLLRSIRATLELQGVDKVRILVEGQEASTFLGYVRP